VRTRLIALIAVASIASTIAGCGSNHRTAAPSSTTTSISSSTTTSSTSTSSTSTSSSSTSSSSASSTSNATGTGAAATASPTTTTAAAAAAAAYPATFVARSTDTKAPGIAVFSSHTGRRLRRLTDGARDIDPLLTADRRWVYFVRVPHDPCPVQLERVPSAGGAATRLAPAGYPGGPVAISQDGRMLAYISTGPGHCRLNAAADTLVLVDLSTGQVHRIASIAWGMAWSPDDRTLAVVGPDPSTGRSVIRLVSKPMSADPAQLRTAPAIQCPTADPCAATSPTFDAQGALFYTAMISHEPGDRCWLSPCHDWTYALVSEHGGRTRVLSTQRPSGDAVLGAGVVNADGSAMIYRLPFGGGYRLWRWSGGGPAAIKVPGGDTNQPVWR
jgi:hypothetical protein